MPKQRKEPEQPKATPPKTKNITKNRVVTPSLAQGKRVSKLRASKLS